MKEFVNFLQKIFCFELLAAPTVKVFLAAFPPVALPKVATPSSLSTSTRFTPVTLTMYSHIFLSHLVRQCYFAAPSTVCRSAQMLRLVPTISILLTLPVPARWTPGACPTPPCVCRAVGVTRRVAQTGCALALCHSPYFNHLSTTKSSLFRLTMPAGRPLPSARELSNIVCAQNASYPSVLDVLSYTTSFKEFLDHDHFLTPESHTRVDIPILRNDHTFAGRKALLFFQSVIVSVPFPREIFLPTNNNAAATDRAYIFGSSVTRSAVLRSFKNGKLVHPTGCLL